MKARMKWGIEIPPQEKGGLASVFWLCNSKVQAKNAAKNNEKIVRVLVIQ